MMQDIMLDIETMGNRSNAVMIQLGAVYFDRLTGKTGDEFCRSLSVKSGEEAGFERDQSTIDWWAGQYQSVLSAILAEAEDARTVMEDFLKFYKKNGTKTRVWSHATFDFVIVQNYLQELTRGWMNHRYARDIRTLVDLSGVNLKKYDWDKKTHNALDDCKFQITYCVEAMDLLRSTKTEGVI